MEQEIKSELGIHGYKGIVPYNFIKTLVLFAGSHGAYTVDRPCLCNDDYYNYVDDLLATVSLPIPGISPLSDGVDIFLSLSKRINMMAVYREELTPTIPEDVIGTSEKVANVLDRISTEEIEYVLEKLRPLLSDIKHKGDKRYVSIKGYNSIIKTKVHNLVSPEFKRKLVSRELMVKEVAKDRCLVVFEDTSNSMKSMKTTTEILKANLHNLGLPIVYYYVDYISIRKEVLTTPQQITDFFSKKVDKKQGTIRYDVLFRLFTEDVKSGSIIIITDNDDEIKGISPAPITLITSTYNEKNDIFVRCTGGKTLVV